MSWIWSLKKEIASNFSGLSVAIWLSTLKFILTMVLKNYLSTASPCSLLTSLFCRSNVMSTCLGFKHVRNLGFEGDQSMYRRSWLLARPVSVCVPWLHWKPAPLCCHHQPGPALQWNTNSVLMCVEWLDFVLDFTWFAEVGKIPYLSVLLWSCMEVWQTLPWRGVI